MTYVCAPVIFNIAFLQPYETYRLLCEVGEVLYKRFRLGHRDVRPAHLIVVHLGLVAICCGWCGKQSPACKLHADESRDFFARDLRDWLGEHMIACEMLLEVSYRVARSLEYFLLCATYARSSLRCCCICWQYLYF